MNSILWGTGPANAIVWGCDKAQMRPQPAKAIIWGSYKPQPQPSHTVIWGN
jgi:hypothetical protein